MATGTDTGTKGMASNFLAKALEKLAKGDEIKQKHDDGKKEIDDAKQMFINLMQNAYTRKAPLAPENPYTPEITPINPIVNAGMPPTTPVSPIGKILTKAPFSTQAEADKDLDEQLKQQEIDNVMKVNAARQEGDTQNITTNTLGTGLVKQNIENVPGRLSIFESIKDTTTPNNKLQDAITLENIKAANREKLKKMGQEKALSEIPIMEYDPLDPSKMKKIGSFMGRQGMSPRLIAKSNVMTDTANSTIASQDVAMGNLSKMKTIMQQGNIGNVGVLIAQKIPNNTLFNIAVEGLYEAGTINDVQLNDLLEFKAEFDSAKQNIAVARGGKQLTITELQLILNTLPTAFQNPEIWDGIINRYANEFNTYRKGLTKGKSDVVNVETKNAKETKGGIKIGSAMQNLLKGK